MGAVEHAKARVLGQHALQAAREAGRLAVAEHDDRRRALLILRRGLRLAACVWPWACACGQENPKSTTSNPARPAPRAPPKPRIHRCTASFPL